MDEFKQILLDRLIKAGADSSSLGGILKVLSKLLFFDPDIDPAAANERLHYLGWPEVDVDYHTLQLALACFEMEDGHRRSPIDGQEHKPQAIRLQDVEIGPIALNDI